MDKNAWSTEAITVIRGALDRAKHGDVVVFDFDNTCVRGDCGALIHAELSDDLAWAWLAGFLDQLPAEVGGAQIRALHTEWTRLGPNDASTTRPRPSVDLASIEARLAAESVAVFTRHFEAHGPLATYRWVTTLYAGMRLSELRARAARLFEQETARPFESQDYVADDGTRTSVSRGLRPRLCFAELVRAFESRGASCWVVSASNEWTVEACSRWMGVPRARIIGNRAVVVDGVITAQVDGPTTWGPGKVDAIRARIGAQRPLLAFGDSRTDEEMLDDAHDAVFVARDAAGERYAATKRWACTPARSLD